jgi:hypothetical protein
MRRLITMAASRSWFMEWIPCETNPMGKQKGAADDFSAAPLFIHEI